MAARPGLAAGLAAGLAGSVAGCAEAVPLSEVPIAGGSDAARSAVRDELLAFDAAVGPGAVRLVEVAFEPVDGGLARYQELPPRVAIDRGVTGDALAPALRHALCLALDHQADLLRAPVPVLDAFGAWLVAPDGGALPRRPSPRERRAEAMATLCELGPLEAWTLTHPCPGDPARAASAYGWADAHVWRAWERPETGAVGGGLASFTAPRAFLSAVVTATDAPGRLSIALHHPGGAVAQYGAELWTGAPAPSGTALVPPAAPESSGAVWGIAGGPMLSILAFPGLPGWFEGSPEPRLVLTEDRETWLIEDGCLEQAVAWNVFFADWRFWYAWADGHTVSWAPLPAAR